VQEGKEVIINKPSHLWRNTTVAQDRAVLCCAVLMLVEQVPSSCDPGGGLLLGCSGSTLSSPGWLAAWSDWVKAAAAPMSCPQRNMLCFLELSSAMTLFLFSRCQLSL
jgi:hypothetical protein